MKYDIVGVGERLIAKRVEEKESVKDGIIIPDNAQEKPQIAVVVAVGEGARDFTTGERIPLSLKPGDTILLPQFGITEVKVNDEQYVICKEDDVLCKLKEK